MKQEYLNLFTSKDPLPRRFHNPFTIGEYVYACDSHKAIRLSKSDVQTEYAEKDIEIEQFFNVEPNSSFEVKVEAIEKWFGQLKHYPVYSDCEACKGSGYLEIKGKYPDECESCNGTGDSNEIIRTEPKPDKMHKMKDVAFGFKGLKVLVEIAKSEKVNPVWIVRSRNKANLFTLNGIEIILMPMSY
jgi:hypothetical protein